MGIIQTSVGIMPTVYDVYDVYDVQVSTNDVHHV
jgi:hypothetical protein